MECPRLNHFVRLNPNGTVSRCGHMIKPAQFATYDDLNNSSWLHTIKTQFANDEWPEECIRCKLLEESGNKSLRNNSLDLHIKQTRDDYLIVGGVLDNICNSACIMCSENLSTKIGSLTSKNYPIIDNTNPFKQLPQDRIVQLDINGGEPSASKNYKRLLNNLPPNLKSLRVNTNCAIILDELVDISNRGIDVTVTVSFDGIDKVHDYIRWPIPYDKFIKNLMVYKSMPVNLNLWTTVSALNIGNLKSIFEFVNNNGFNHSWALLSRPDELNVKYKNWLTLSADVPDCLLNQVAVADDNSDSLSAFLTAQDAKRNITYKDYYEV